MDLFNYKTEDWIGSSDGTLGQDLDTLNVQIGIITNNPKVDPKEAKKQRKCRVNNFLC